MSRFFAENLGTLLHGEKNPRWLDYLVVPYLLIFFSYNPRINAAFFCLGAAFIRGRHLLVILLPSAAFSRGRRLFDGGV